MAINWRFPPLSGGNEQGYTNSGIETFKGEELMDNLAREICQNSLDAKDKDCEFPVEVTFELRHIEKLMDNVFSEFSECLNGCRAYWSQDEQEMDERLKSFLSRAETALSYDCIPVLVASDYNTTGLTGSRTSKKSAWKALTHSDGTSIKNEAGSAGSYGIGKNAPFACSDLSMVFYNTYAKDGVKAFKGVSRLATILDNDNVPTQGVGHYQNNGENTWQPIFGEDSSPFRDLFNRVRYGTDIIIIGFNESDQWDIRIEKAIINHFFPAIYEGKLVVSVNGRVINKTTIADKIQEEFAGDKDVKITGQLFEAMINPDRNKMFSILEENDAELFIKSDSGYGRTITNFRSSGMLVGKYARRILQHYAAVLIVRGQALNELLRDTEPPKHNKWDHKLIEKHEKEKRKLARKCIGEIENSIISLLKEQYETVNETVVDSDTGEYIPDYDDELGRDVVGDDVLKVRQQLGAIRKRKNKAVEALEDAKRSTGKEKKSVDIHNKTVNPDSPPTPPKPQVEPDTEDGVSGVSSGRGTKQISSVSILKQRVYPLNLNQGLYRAVILPQENYEDVYISFSAIGEDGSAEKLETAYYSFDGKKRKNASDRIGPIRLQRDVFNEIIVCLESKEKMVLRMSVTGGRTT